MNTHDESLRRWRLILGSNDADGTGYQLSGKDKNIDDALGALYEYQHSNKFEYGEKNLKGGSGASSPAVARWLGDIRNFFPNTVVQVMQNDAMKEPALQNKLILEPEILEQTTPDVHLVSHLLNLGKLIPEKTKATARIVVKKVVDDLMQKLEQKTISSIKGALNKQSRKFNPKFKEIDWNLTIKKNLKHYQPNYKTIIPEIRVGFGHKSKSSIKDIVLCIDQSGSMGTSVVYSGIFGSVMASIPNIKTKMFVFDTQVVDLTDDLKDPIDLLFGVQLGGGTDINLALSKCQESITRPDDTILILISDLEEGGNLNEMKKRAVKIVESGVQVICLLSLNDDGSPWYSHENAKFFSDLGVPVFCCTPDLFPDLMAAAINKKDLKAWAGDNEIVVQ